MTYPKTIWNYSKRTEAERILQAAYHIQNQFYLKKGFLVLPYNIPKNPAVIFFPKLNYQKIPQFWQEAKNAKKNAVLKKRPIIDHIVNILLEENLDYSQLKKDWQKKEKIFWQYVIANFPSYFKNVQILEIRPTLYGSIATAYSSWFKDNTKIIIYIREDADVSHIPEALFIDRLRVYKRASDEDYSWEYGEAIIDFLLTETKLAAIFPNYKETLTSLRNFQEGKFIKESKEYLRSLGVYLGRIFEIKNNQIFIKGKPNKIILSSTQEKILHLLIKNRQKIVSFDEIADVIWGEKSYDKFSEYAITKTIQRLREKVSLMGVFPQIIQTVRKRGYVLMD